MDELIEQIDESTGRRYIVWQGVKWWLWENKNNYYVSQCWGRGKAKILQRELLGLTDRYTQVYAKDGNMRNLSLDNLATCRLGTRNHAGTKRTDYIEYDDKRFYAFRKGYWYSKVYGFLHRYVWAQHNGPIPHGYTIHHIDMDKNNNNIENLQCLSYSEHSKVHGKTSKWVGSKANKQQLKKAGEKARAWHASPEGRAWHSEHARKCGFGKFNRKNQVSI